MYSYAITLFECVCGSVHTRKEYRRVSRMAACSGWRPTPTDNLVETYPLLWALIQESWRPETHAVVGKGLRDLRIPLAKRPTFADIVLQLITMKPVSANSDSADFDVFPKKDDRFICTKVPIEEWRQALCLETGAQLQARHQTVVAEEIAICRDAGPAWQFLSHRSIPSNVRAEWQSTEDTSARLYRFTYPLEHDDPDTIFSAACASFGTAKSLTLGDRNIEQMRLLGAIDNSHLVLWQSFKMPRPLHNRHGVNVTFFDKETRICVSKAVPTACRTLLTRSLGEPLIAGMAQSTVYHYTIKVNAVPGGGASITCLVQIDLHVGEGILSGFLRKVADVGSDRSGISICKGQRGVAKRADELARWLSLASLDAAHSLVVSFSHSLTR